MPSKGLSHLRARHVASQISPSDPHILRMLVDLCRLGNEACYVMICMSPTGYNGQVMTADFFAPPL